MAPKSQCIENRMPPNGAAGTKSDAVFRFNRTLPADEQLMREHICREWYEFAHRFDDRVVKRNDLLPAAGLEPDIAADVFRFNRIQNSKGVNDEVPCYPDDHDPRGELQKKAHELPPAGDTAAYPSDIYRFAKVHPPQRTSTNRLGTKGTYPVNFPQRGEIDLVTSPCPRPQAPTPNQWSRYYTEASPLPGAAGVPRPFPSPIPSGYPAYNPVANPASFPAVFSVPNSATCPVGFPGANFSGISVGFPPGIPYEICMNTGSCLPYLQ